MSRSRIYLALTFAIPFIVYVCTMARVWAIDTIFAIDSAEMVIAAHTLGIDHPPGHPLYLIFAHLFSRLPFSLLDTGVILTSAFFSALACVFLTLVLKAITDNWYIALATGATFAFARVFWIHATLAEVYALQFSFLALYLCLIPRLLGRPDPQSLYVIAFVLGLSTTVNILLTILILPSFLFVVMRSGIFVGETSWPLAVHFRAKLFALLGMSPMLYIPIRLTSESAFISDFVYLNGYPLHSLRWYIWYFSAEEFTGTKLFDLPLSLYPTLLIDYLTVFSDNTTPFTLILALLGIAVLCYRKRKTTQEPQSKRRRQRPAKSSFVRRMLAPTTDAHRTWSTSVLIAFVTTLIPVLSYRVPDREVFFMPSFFFLIALSGIGCACLFRWLPQKVQPAILVIPLFLIVNHYSSVTTITANKTRYNNRAQRFEQLPQNAIILGPDDGHATRYKYFQIVRKMRPDITIYTMGMLAPRVRQAKGFLQPDFALNFNVIDRLNVIKHLRETHPDRPLFAILDDRMPPEYDHFRTQRSSLDPYLLQITEKPEPEVSDTMLPVAVRVEDGYFNTFRFIGFSIQGLDRGLSHAYGKPVQISGRTVYGEIQRSEIFELAYQIQNISAGSDKIFAEFAFVNEHLEIPSVQGFTAAKTVEIIPEGLPSDIYRQDRFTFKIPGYIPPGLYTLAVRATRASDKIQAQYRGKPIRGLVPLQTKRTWQDQTDYRPLGTIRLQ